jgi:hypothetical protein
MNFDQDAFIISTIIASLTAIYLIKPSLRKPFRYLVLGSLFLIIIVPLSTLITIGSHPRAIEEGLYFGLSQRIIRDGQWIPFKFSDNDYYQLYHVAANYMALIRIVTDMDIYVVKTILTLTFTSLITMLGILLARLFCDRFELLSIPLTVTSGPLLIMFTVYRCSVISAILALINIYLLLKILFNGKMTVSSVVSLNASLVTGTLAHPLFFVYNVAMSFLVMLRRRNIFNYLVLLTVVNIVYWIFTVIIKTLIHVIHSFVNLFIEFLQHAGVESTYVPWYEAVKVPTIVAFSWSILPSLAISHMLYILIKFKKPKKLLEGSCMPSLFALGLIGLSFLFSLIFKRSSLGLGTVHFYPLTLLLVPSAVLAVSEMVRKNKLINIAIVTMLIFASTYGALLDPMYNAKSPALGITDCRSWTVGLQLSSILAQDTVFVGDFRLSSPNLYGNVIFDHPSSLYGAILKPSNYLVVVAFDEKGLAVIKRSLFFNSHPRLREQLLNLRERHALNFVFNDGLYQAFFIATEEV